MATCSHFHSEQKNITKNKHLIFLFYFLVKFLQAVEIPLHEEIRFVLQLLGHVCTLDSSHCDISLEPHHINTQPSSRPLGCDPPLHTPCVCSSV